MARLAALLSGAVATSVSGSAAGCSLFRHAPATWLSWIQAFAAGAILVLPAAEAGHVAMGSIAIGSAAVG